MREPRPCSIKNGCHKLLEEQVRILENCTSTNIFAGHLQQRLLMLPKRPAGVGIHLKIKKAK
jgi:hypothetical protein